MPRWLKHCLLVLLLVVFGGCAGSCSGCSGCGVTPLPGGFPNAERIENSSSVRVTDTGLAFIGDNIGALAPQLLGSGSASAGVLTFDVPKSSFNESGFKGSVCPNGSLPNANPPECVAEADLGKANLTIATKAPHNITVTGTLAVRLRKLPVKGTFLGLIPIDVEAVLTNGAKCSPRDYANIPVNIDISLETDTDPTHAARQGYTRVKIAQLSIDDNAIESSIGFCGSGIDDAIVNLVKGFLIGSLIGGLTDTLTETIEDQLCTTEDPGAGVTCPTGTYPDSGGTCRYCQPDGTGKCPNSNDECVAIALGVDGNINLSAFLASISPGTKGGFDFLAALGGAGVRDDGSGMHWGDLNPIGGGMTIGMIGGAIPQPLSSCVPTANVEKPTNVPIPDELLGNTVPGWTGAGPHFGAAVSERYLNYVLGTTYNSGALCLGVGSNVLGSLLNSDTLGLLMPSFKDLARQKQKAALALLIRPQEPPSIVVGKGTDIETDPLLKLTLNKFNIDFYIWSSDRFIRAFTAGFDIVAPINLDVTEQGELQPVIDKVEVNNPTVTNADLLREDEKTAADALAGIVAGQVGSALGGAIGPINLNDSLASLGLTLEIPPSVPGQGSPGLTKLEKGSDRFLGVFAAFGVASAGNTAPLLESDTRAEVGDKRVDPAGLWLPTITKDNRPKVELRLSSVLDDGSQTIEYQYRLDGGFWKPWTTKRQVTIDDPILSLQMRHQIEVRSRVVGLAETLDRTPVKLEVLIDKTAPDVAFAKSVKDGSLGIEVTDVVSPPAAVRVRWALDDGPFGEWTLAEGLKTLDVGNAASLKLEAEDEEGNVAQVQHSLIRGKQDPSLASDSGCNCSVPGNDGRGAGPWGLAALGALGAFLLSRRRRSAPPPRPTEASRRPFRWDAQRTRWLGGIALMAIGMSWSGCSCSDDEESNNPGDGGVDSGKPPGACPVADTCSTIIPGLVGAYASAAVDSEGSIWVAAYNDLGYEIAPDQSESQYLFGDLVVGKWDGTKVEWQTVDGLPPVDTSLDPGDPGGPPDPFLYDITGFRFGLTDPGEDVGLWTSIAIEGGAARVAYYDAKNRALKFAAQDGGSWTIHTVEKADDSDIGRYAKLLYVDGKPVIAYQAIRPGSDGAAESAVRVATGKSATPGAATDWTIVDAVVDPATPCSSVVCGSQECRADTLKCQATTGGCDPKCGTGQKCFDEGGTPACADVLDDSTATFPEAIGGYISLASTSSGLGIVYYDRIHGNLMALHEQGGAWQPPILLDGQSSGANPVDTGDVGIGASLFVDGAGDWHVAYANGFDESLRYMKVTGGTTPGTSEIVDDGITTDGTAVVGDDTSIRVTSAGEVQIAYQNATHGEVRWATGPGTWTKKTLQVDDFAGGFNRIVESGGQVQVLTWWRRAKPRTEGDIILLSP